MAFATGSHSYGEVVGPCAAGNESFAAIHNVVIAVFYSTGFQVGNVGTAARFCDGQSRNLIAAENRGNNVFSDFLLGPLGNGWQADVERANAGNKAARG